MFEGTTHSERGREVVPNLVAHFPVCKLQFRLVTLQLRTIRSVGVYKVRQAFAIDRVRTRHRLFNHQLIDVPIPLDYLQIRVHVLDRVTVPGVEVHSIQYVTRVEMLVLQVRKGHWRFDRDILSVDGNNVTEIFPIHESLNGQTIHDPYVVECRPRLDDLHCWGECLRNERVVVIVELRGNSQINMTLTSKEFFFSGFNFNPLTDPITPTWPSIIIS